METTRDILHGFIVFEGIDGSGTSTQLSALSKRLDGLGYAHKETWEPTDSPIGALIRQTLSGHLPAHPGTVARLFAADRGEHLYGNGGIVELARAGSLVISDRYLFSSLAYQGLTCGPELPGQLNAGFPLPQLLLFFDIDPRIAAKRLAARKSLDIYENIGFQVRVDNAYREVIASFEGSGMTIARIDASRSEEEVEQALWAIIGPIVSNANKRQSL